MRDLSSRRSQQQSERLTSRRNKNVHTTGVQKKTGVIIAMLMAATCTSHALHAAAQPATEMVVKTAVLQDAAVADAKTLIGQKRFTAAFDKLSALEVTRAGDANFDYWLGVAAFESGRLERAAIAFERALVVDPEFDSARIELGRTYLRMGSLDLAEQEFRRLLPRTSRPEGKQLLESYLGEIARLKAKQKFSTKGFIELGVGHDTNLSSTTGSFSDAIRTSFGLTGILPSGNSIKRSDNFGALNTGGDLVWRYREDRTLFATAGARLRSYKNYNDYL